jgi:hypothetical protein
MARKKASFSSFLFGVLFGIILVIGSVAAGGYWAYNNLTIGHIESLTNQNFEFIAAESELRTKALKEYITEFQGIPELTFSQFSEQYGINFPADIAFLTDALHDQKIKDIKNFPTAIMERVRIGSILGSPYNDFETYPKEYDGDMPAEADSLMWTLRTYTITGDEGISTLAEDFTVQEAKDIFSLTLPSFLETPEVLSSPLTDLGSAIDNLYLTALFEEPENDETMSDRLLSRIFDMKVADPEAEGGERPYRLSEASLLFADLPEELTIQDLLGEAPTGTDIGSKIMLDLYNTDCSLDDISAETQTVVNNLDMQKLIVNEPDSSTAAGNILNKIWTENPKINELETKIENVINSLTIQDIILAEPETDTAYGRILNKLWHGDDNGDPINITQLGNASITFYLSDVLPEPEPPDIGEAPTAFNLITFLRGNKPDTEENYTIDEIDDALEDMTIEDIFGTDDGIDGIFSLFDSNTRIMDLGGQAVADSIANANLNDLLEAGIITEAQISNLSTDQRENVTLSAIIQIINNNSSLIPD